MLTAKFAASINVKVHNILGQVKLMVRTTHLRQRNFAHSLTNWKTRYDEKPCYYLLSVHCPISASLIFKDDVFLQICVLDNIQNDCFHFVQDIVELFGWCKEVAPAESLNNHMVNLWRTFRYLSQALETPLT